MGSSKLVITSKTVDFSEFKLLHNKITISLLPGGIVIYPGIKSDSCLYYYESVLDKQKRTIDKILINILTNRGVSEKTPFICVGNHHYIEITPHPAK